MDKPIWQHLPVTALSYLNDNHVISGEGPQLNVYGLSTFKKHSTLFSHSKSVIHWITTLSIPADVGDDNANLLICYGGEFLGVAEWSDYRLLDHCNYFKCIDLIKHSILINSSSSVCKCFTISAHNIVQEYEVAKSSGKWTPKSLRSWRSTDSSILYSALLFHPPTSFKFSLMLVASGTAFGELLLWEIPDQSNIFHEDVTFPVEVEVAHTLKEHRGAIFAIDFNFAENLLCSVSDDRTVAVFHCSQSGNLSGWKFSLLMRIFGHDARIWDCRITSWGVVTVGENSQILAWNWQKELCFRSKSHQGRSIWSMDLDNDKLVTGGNDGAICLHDLSQQNSLMELCLSLPESVNDKIQFSSQDFPRSLYFNQERILYVICDSGYVISYNVSNEKWSLAYDGTSKFSSYCTVSWSKSGARVLFGGIRGDLEVLSLDEGDFSLVCVHSSQYEGKIMTCHWLDSHTSTSTQSILISLKEDGLMILLSVLGNGSISMSESNQPQRFTLPVARAHRWITAAVQIDNLIIVGDREGRLHIYQLGLEDPVFTRKCHDKSGVTDVIYDHCHDQLISSGKTGVVYRWKIVNNHRDGLSLMNLGMIKNPGGATSIFRLNVRNEDIVAEGFHSTEFRVVTLSSEVCHFKSNCGGANRSWDFWSSRGANEAHELSDIFAFINKGRVQIHTQRTAANKTNLKNSLHGAEINSCLAVPMVSDFSNQDKKNLLLITGCEDCCLCSGILSLHDTDRPLLFQRQKSHISSIRNLSRSTVLRRGASHHQDKDIWKAPFSAIVAVGGRSMLSVWRCDELDGQNLSGAVLLLATKQLKLPIKSSKFATEDFHDLRIMSAKGIWLKRSIPLLLVIMACSDGSIYIQQFNCQTYKLRDTIGAYSVAANACLLDLAVIEPPKCSQLKESNPQSMWIITAGTRGILYLCQLDCSVDDELEELSMDVISELQISLCAANCLDVSNFFLVVGGDDGAVHMARISQSSNGEGNIQGKTELSRLTSSPPEHTAGISRVAWLNPSSLHCEFFLSMGADQRLLLWRFRLKEEVRPLRCILLGVSDPHDFSIVIEGDNTVLAFVVGNGAEIVRLSVPGDNCTEEELIGE